jgi:hypothetical protein
MNQISKYWSSIAIALKEVISYSFQAYDDRFLGDGSVDKFFAFRYSNRRDVLIESRLVYNQNNRDLPRRSYSFSTDVSLSESVVRVV